MEDLSKSLVAKIMVQIIENQRRLEAITCINSGMQFAALSDDVFWAPDRVGHSLSHRV